MPADTVDLLSRTTDRSTTITRDSALARLSEESCQLLVVERVVRAAWLDTRGATRSRASASLIERRRFLCGRAARRRVTVFELCFCAVLARGYAVAFLSTGGWRVPFAFLVYVNDERYTIFSCSIFFSNSLNSSNNYSEIRNISSNCRRYLCLDLGEQGLIRRKEEEKITISKLLFFRHIPLSSIISLFWLTGGGLNLCV